MSKKYIGITMKTLQDFGLPKDKLFYTLTEIKNIGLMSTERAKQLIYKGEIQSVKNGRNHRISRVELIRYLNDSVRASSDILPKG